MEPAVTPPSQIAADLVKVAVDRKALFNSAVVDAPARP
jgi:hypothetical protein